MEKLIISKETLGEAYMKGRFYETGQAVKCLKMAKAAVMSILPYPFDICAKDIAEDVNNCGKVQGAECEVVTPEDVADFASRAREWNERTFYFACQIRGFIEEIRQMEKEMADHAVCKK